MPFSRAKTWKLWIIQRGEDLVSGHYFSSWLRDTGDTRANASRSRERNRRKEKFLLLRGFVHLSQIILVLERSASLVAICEPNGIECNCDARWTSFYVWPPFDGVEKLDVVTETRRTRSPTFHLTTFLRYRISTLRPEFTFNPNRANWMTRCFSVCQLTAKFLRRAKLKFREESCLLADFGIISLLEFVRQGRPSVVSITFFFFFW